MQCKGGFLFGLKYTDSTSASEWAIRSIENYVTLPKTFEELQKIPLNKTYKFLYVVEVNICFINFEDTILVEAVFYVIFVCIEY